MLSIKRWFLVGAIIASIARAQDSCRADGNNGDQSQNCESETEKGTEKHVSTFVLLLLQIIILTLVVVQGRGSYLY